MRRKNDIIGLYFREFFSKGSTFNEKGDWEKYKKFVKNKKAARTKNIFKTSAVFTLILVSIILMLKSKTDIPNPNIQNKQFIVDTLVESFQENTPSKIEMKIDTTLEVTKSLIKKEEINEFSNKKTIFTNTLMDYHIDSNLTLTDVGQQNNIDSIGTAANLINTTTIMVNKKVVHVKKQVVVKKKTIKKRKLNKQVLD